MESQPVMRVVEWATLDERGRTATLERGLDAIFDPALFASIQTLVARVRDEGDAALVHYLREFDRVEVDASRIKVGDDEIAEARSQLPDALIDAIRDLISHVRSFNEQLMAAHGDWMFESEPGLTVGEKVSPIASAGLFVPSGKGSFPSVLGQIGTPAVVAGVPTIAVVVPPVPGGAGEVDPAVLVVADELGLRDVFRCNGPAGIAALAFGTETIPKVRKVLGPGSPPVACAQLEVQRWGTAGVLLLGPSESLIVADATADPERLAADLLNEAEHGPDSSSWLVTPSRDLIAATEVALATQLAALPEPRQGYARIALGRNGGVIVVDDLGTAIDVANRYAPEHMQLVVDPAVETEVLDGLVNAGEILLGQDTPISAANFVVGCPAALPTSGYAAVSSGITVEAFLKRSAVARADRRAMERMAPSVLALAGHEGFPAHANAVAMRLQR